MKRFKLIVGVFCLAILLIACNGNIRSKMSTPDEVYGKNTESGKPAVASSMIENNH